MINNNLPVVHKNILPDNIKKGISKMGKITGYTAMTGLFATAYIASMTLSPVLILPSMFGLLYSSQKLLNQTLYQSHKDVAFITKKNKNTTKIYQDVLRPDISIKLKDMSEIDKAAFMQLQAIVGISKLNRLDRKRKSYLL